MADKMTLEQRIRQNIDRIEERIETACQNSGRKRGEIQLMGVTKFHGIEAAETAFKAGLTLFGESRVQEAKEKFSRFYELHARDSAALHLIGSLQRNKAKIAASFFPKPLL